MKFNSLTLFTLLGLAALLFTTCKKDPCKDTVCGANEICVDGDCIADPCENVACLNGGTCTNGTCDCPPEYSGPDCSVPANARFTGTFNSTNSQCDTVALDPYPIQLRPSLTDPLGFTIGGLYENSLANVVGCTANLLAEGTFNIPQQPFTDEVFGGGFVITGSGSINATNTEVTVDFVLFDTVQVRRFDGCVNTFAE